MQELPSGITSILNNLCALHYFEDAFLLSLISILFITDNFPPEVNAPATRTYEHCREWVRAGAKVTVVTCVPNFPAGKVFKGYRNKLFQKEEVDGIQVIRVWSYIAKNKGVLKRIIDYLSFSLSAICVSFFLQRPDIIVATSPQFFSAVAGKYISFFRRRPWIMEVRDIWPESIAAVNAIRNKRIYRFLEKMELSLYHSAQKIIVVTDSFKENLISRNIDESKIAVIKNGIDPNQYFPREKNHELLKALELEDKIVVGYIGTLGLAHKLEFVLNCIQKIEDPRIHFLFIGEGAEKQKLQKKARDEHLERVHFLNSVNKDVIPEYLSIIDVALIPLKKSSTFMSVLPSKIFESAAMGIPILLGVEGEAKQLVEAYKAGLCYEPENEMDFLDKLNTLCHDQLLRSTLGKGGRQLAMHFDRKLLAKEMLKIIVSQSNK